MRLHTSGVLRGVLTPLVAGAALVAGTVAGPATTGPATTGSSAAHGVHAPALVRTAAATGNPLAGRPWGVYKGNAEQSWAPFDAATGRRKKLLGYIALKPKAKWFGAWIADNEITGKVRDYVTNAQAGDPDALVQMTIFRAVPWEQDACRRLPTRAERASYRRWIDNFARGLGDTPAAVVMQPDGPFALCAPHGSLALSRLVRYGTRTLSALPHTSVYVEVGAADWPHAGPPQGGVATAAKIAVRGGVKYARGIALNGTHYSATAHEVARGAAVLRALARRGMPGKHVVINTSGNGHPFNYGTYTGADANNPDVCLTRHEPATRTCVTLGIPPTSHVAARRWHLPRHTRRLARKYVDGYLWFGRPWLIYQNNPFSMFKALHLVRTTPFRR